MSAMSDLDLIATDLIENGHRAKMGGVPTWHALDLPGEDWDDPRAAAGSALWGLCGVLSGYESPAWGNVSGRYDINWGWGDGLDDGDWADLRNGEFGERMGDPDWGWMVYTMQAAYDHIAMNGESGLVDILHVCDILRAVLELTDDEN